MPQESFEARLHELLDRRARPEECDELRALAEESPACRDLLLAQQQLFEGFEADEIPELPGNFAQRVVAEHCAVQPLNLLPSKQKRGIWILELAAVAALALVVIGGAASVAPTPQGGVAAAPRDPVTAPPVAVPQVAVPSPERVIDDVPVLAPDKALAQHAAGDAEPGEVVIPRATDATSARYDELYYAILERLPNRQSPEELLALRPQWVDEVALGLRPVATSFGGAINTLRSTLPPSSKSERSDKPQAQLLSATSHFALV